MLKCFARSVILSLLFLTKVKESPHDINFDILYIMKRGLISSLESASLGGMIKVN